MQKLSLLDAQKNKAFKNGVFRNITIHEAEALQTLPKDYTAGIALSNRFKALGNSFTCEVILNSKRFKEILNQKYESKLFSNYV